MRHAHRSDCDDRCNGDWCECPCHERLEGALTGGEAIEKP